MIANIINRNDISTTKSTFNSIDNLSSTTGQILNSNFSTVGLKAVGSDERKFDILAVTVTPPRRHVVLQSTADCSVRLTPSSYHYRTPTRTDPKTASPQTPSYMAPTISSAMKTKKMAERCTSLESPLWTSRRGHSISEELRTAVSFTPSRKREGHRSRLTLWQQETSQTLPKLYYKERFVNSCPEAKSLTTECGIANELNNENLRRASSQPLFRVARSSLRHGGLYNNYLKQLYWDRITSKYNKISQKESFMKGKDQGAEDFASIDGQNAQMEISLHVKQTELQLSPRNSYREETFRFHLDRDHLSRQDQIDNDILTPNLCTAQVKTPRGWQRTFSRAPSKVSRFDRFASQFVETVSTQVWMTKTSLGQFPPYTLAETARYNIWQCVFGNSSQKISRFNRFQKGPETKDTKFTFQPAQYISQLEQFTNEFILTESKMLRGLIWKRTVSKASPKTSRFDRFLVPDNSVTNITQGNTRSEQFESEVPLDSAAIQSLLSNTPRSPETVPIPRQSTVFYEQAKLIPLPEVSCKSNSSSLHNTQLRSLNASLTESLSSEKLSEKHSNFTIKSLCEVTSSECFKKNIASSSRTSETQSSEGSVLSDVIFHGESFCKRSKSTLQRTSRSDCFQKTLSTSSIASTKSFEALTISKSLFSRVSTRKQSKTSRLLRRTSRFERFQKNTISILSTARANSLSPSILLDISSSEGTLSERSKSTPSLQFPRQTCISPSKHSTSPCIWNLLMAKPKEKSSRIERFQNSASLDLRTARNQLSNSSLFYDISLIPSSGRCSQTKVIPSIQEKITTNTFNSWQKEKMSDKSSRFERFESSLLPNTHTAQSTCSQNLSTKRFLKKQTEQEESYKISYKKHFKTDHFTSEKIIEASGAKCCHRDDHSLCSDSSVYSLLTARQRSAEQSVTCHSPDSIDLCKNECPADSTAQTIIKSGPDQKLEQRTSYRERLDNPASISSKINVFNEIKGGKSSELWNRSIVQQTILDRKEEQYFDGEFP
uniref:Uncharacterized protein n=1 Tax=Elaeophora elaphi TaxID=1147741 RepID=A0A0R3RFG2_9BILA